MRNRLNIYFSPELLRQIADLASRRKLSQSAIIEAAVTSFLSLDGMIAAKRPSRAVSTG
jgi:predicted transcriptional regulator